jgi:hypothetical protein
MRDRLRELLIAEDNDVGCDAAWAVLESYVEATMRGEDPEQRFPGVAAHHRGCVACRADFEGLLAAVRREAKGESRWD